MNNQSCFISGRFHIYVSALRPTVITDGFHDISQSEADTPWEVAPMRQAHVHSKPLLAYKLNTRHQVNRVIDVIK